MKHQLQSALSPTDFCSERKAIRASSGWAALKSLMITGPRRPHKRSILQITNPVGPPLGVCLGPRIGSRRPYVYVSIVVFVGVIFAILLQLNRELWETEREMMRLPSEPDGAEYSGLTAISQRSPVSLRIEGAGPTPSISPNTEIKDANAHGEELSNAQTPSGGIPPALPIGSHWRLVPGLPGSTNRQDDGDPQNRSCFERQEGNAESLENAPEAPQIALLSVERKAECCKKLAKR